MREDLLNLAAILRGQLAAMQQQIDEMRGEIEQLRRDNKLEDFEIARLRHEIYGNKFERIDPKQQTLPLGEPSAPTPSDAVEEEDDSTQANRRRRKKPRSRFAIAPKRVINEVRDHFRAQTKCPHCEHALSSISYTSKTVVERIPAKYRSIEHRCHQMAFRLCSRAGVSIARPVESPIPGCGGVGISLEVHSTTQHLKDHLPYHRIAEFFEREGLQIDRGYLSRVGQSVGSLLAPAAEQTTHERFAELGAVGCDGNSLRMFASPHCARRAVYVLHGSGHVVFRALEKQTADESERLLRSIVVGRKAWLCRGTFESAQNTCVLWSLMQSCRSLHVNPAKYLADVIEAMDVVSASELHEWTARAYAARTSV